MLKLKVDKIIFKTKSLLSKPSYKYVPYDSSLSVESLKES